MAVAITDIAGDPGYFEKMDGTRTGSVNVAITKARPAARYRAERWHRHIRGVIGARHVAVSPGSTAVPLEEAAAGGIAGQEDVGRI